MSGADGPSLLPAQLAGFLVEADQEAVASVSFAIRRSGDVPRRIPLFGIP